MTKYEKIKIILFIAAIVSFLIIGYLNSISGRYVMHPAKAIVIDSMTGDVYDLRSKEKIN